MYQLAIVFVWFQIGKTVTEESPSAPAIQDFCDPQKTNLPSSNLVLPTLEFQIVDHYDLKEDTDIYDRVSGQLPLIGINEAEDKAIFSILTIRTKPTDKPLKIERGTVARIKKFLDYIGKKDGTDSDAHAIILETDGSHYLLMKREKLLIVALTVKLENDKFMLCKDESETSNLFYAHTFVKETSIIETYPKTMLDLGDDCMKLLKDKSCEILYSKEKEKVVIDELSESTKADEPVSGFSYNLFGPSEPSPVEGEEGTRD